MLRKIIIPVMLSCGLWSQGLFDSAVSTPATEQSPGGLGITGFVRSTAYVNQTPADEYQLQSGYGEVCLKFQATPNELADIFTELRFRSGHEFGEDMAEYDIVEAYVNAYLWKFDLRFGKQIVAWGRADGINPTNNITPQNTTVRSPDPDDMLSANYLVRAYLNLRPEIRLEGIWVPQYSPTVLAFEMADLPSYVTIGDGEYPDSRLENSLLAGRLNLELPAFDGSISYVSGYNPMPGIKLEAVVINTGATTLIPAAYRQQVFGIDFSTGLGDWGLRGEAAWRVPEKKHDGLLNYYIPYSDLHFVIGADRIWNDLNLIVQYIGRYTPDFDELVIPTDPMQQLYPQLENYNRLFNNQTHKYRQAISIRPALSLMYEALSLELYAMYDITTAEVMAIPQVVYQPADGLEMTLGGNYYNGDDDTLYDLIETSYNSIFCELRVTF